jgi:protein-S-isoprenylcysteine O-methyltransferase Ste14
MKKLLPPAYLLMAMIFMVSLNLLLPVKRLIFYPWLLLGIAPLSLGVVINLLADQSLKRNETTVKPFEQSSALVTDGVYRFSRHPMYLGMILILVGVALLLGSLTPWIFVAVVAVLFDAVFIRAEESMMENAFGKAYEDYKDKVRRWI